MFQFYKGRTDNHLTWVMVDATDFATPESALSAATKIKIYGKLRANDTVQFVSSGTGSLTNDIKHVGASVLGIYTIGLVKADLSDASAAWYDQYIISLSATGAAYQTLIADGGIDQSAISAYQSRLSDLASYLVVMSGILSDTYSGVTALSDATSNAYSAAVVGASRILLVQSRLSDLDSRLSSDTSDILSGIVALSGLASDTHSAANVGNSRILLVQSRLSDFNSAFVSQMSDLRSDLGSFMTTTGVGLNASTMSDIRSAINALTVSLDASNISDIASAVVAALPITSQVSDILSLLTRVDSRVLVIQSTTSDTYSNLSDLKSDFQSRVPKRVATDSQLSDLHSDLRSVLVLNASAISDCYSLLSNINSATAASPDLSDIASAVLAEFSDALSDLRSQIGGITATLSASDLSDIRSAILSLSGMLSDTHSAATAAASRALLNQSRISDVQSALLVETSRLSDIYSLLSDLHSDVGVMSGVVSDVYSNLAAGVTVGASSISDITSATWATARAEPTTVVSPTGTMKTGVEWLVALSRNKVTQTTSVQSLRNDADSADIASAAVSDDGTTFIRGEFV